MTERQFQSKVIDLARLCGWKVWHFHDSRREVRPGVFIGDKDSAGFPDLTLVHPGLGIFMLRELKVPPNRLTDEQRASLAMFKACGIDADVWTPADWPTIQTTLTRRK